MQGVSNTPHSLLLPACTKCLAVNIVVFFMRNRFAMDTTSVSLLPCARRPSIACLKTFSKATFSKPSAPLAGTPYHVFAEPGHQSREFQGGHTHGALNSEFKFDCENASNHVLGSHQLSWNEMTLNWSLDLKNRTSSGKSCFTHCNTALSVSAGQSE